jgi:hypothetical protein
VFENSVLRIIFGLKREEVTGGFRILHNEEHHDFYVSLNIIRLVKSRRMRWAGRVARMGDVRNAYNILIVKPDCKRPFGRHSLKKNILPEEHVKCVSVVSFEYFTLCCRPIFSEI